MSMMRISHTTSVNPASITTMKPLLWVSEHQRRQPDQEERQQRSRPTDPSAFLMRTPHTKKVHSASCDAREAESGDHDASVLT